MLQSLNRALAGSDRRAEAPPRYRAMIELQSLNRALAGSDTSAAANFAVRTLRCNPSIGRWPVLTSVASHSCAELKLALQSLNRALAGSDLRRAAIVAMARSIRCNPSIGRWPVLLTRRSH